MNPLTEFDRELLESYLDDALSAEQVEHVFQRTCQEPELAAAMHELRAQRMLRTAAWRSMEPDEARAAALARGVSAVVRQSERRRVWRHAVKVASGVAAALVVFLSGWLMRGTGAPGGLARGPAAPAGEMARPAVASVAVSQVALTDQAGHVLAVQKFDRADEARQFAADLMRYDARRRQAPRGQAVSNSDRF